ncbi:hypothetical protein AB0N09_05200 [Streptomyces erythrochromogenes]|uniref:hypothetical protein n=1 Tax=Streptomyces erythrochromogenes TaxID=285574 RepID=UPI003421DF24
MPTTDPATPHAPEPSDLVLGFDPIPADTPVLRGMPGRPVTRTEMRTPARVLRCDMYVVQIRSEGSWTLPNHDDGAVMRRGDVAIAVRRTMDYWPKRPGRASMGTDNTLYVSNGRMAARYIPAERFADWTPASGTCPGCGTPYSGNGDGPCPGGRSTPKRDYDKEAAELLGSHTHWLRHLQRFGHETVTISVQRADAQQTIVNSLHSGATIYRAQAGGVVIEGDNGESGYWLQPVTGDPHLS